MSRCLVLLVLCVSLGARAAEDVPFVVTPDRVAVAMLQLANVGPEDYVIDLGAGDGRIVIAAVKRFGARGLGVEIDPKLVELSRENARAAGVAGRAHFREQDLFKTDLSPASVITMYLLPDSNLQLRSRLLKLRPGTRIVSHDWDMGDWGPDKSITVEVPDKPIGREKTSRVHLWIVPARIEGTWCGTGKAKGASLELSQEFQRFRAQLRHGEVSDRLEGRIRGVTAAVPRKINFHLEGDKLRVQPLDKKYSGLQRALFAPARGGRCG